VGLKDFVFAVVLADYVEKVGEAVVVIVGDVGAEERLCDGARGVVLVEGVDEGFEDGDGDVGFGCVVDLVACGPEDDAGVVAVALHRVGGVVERPLLEVEMVVIGVLGDGPAVEHLLHDEKAHAVGEIEELGCGRVVRRADCVDAEGAESGEATLPCGEWDCRAEGSGVGVEGRAVDLMVDAVEEEALVGVEVEFADAEGDLFVVDELAVAEKDDVSGVEGGVIEVPAIRIGDVKGFFKVASSVRGDDFGDMARE
jgi:hypothetical protein